jgi:DHA1 family tetracycline resistance protein-like MFS transporter
MRRYPVVLALALALFFWMLGHQVLPTTWAFYTKEKFAWSSTEIGFSLAFAGVLMAVVQAGLTRVLIPRLGERRAVWLGLSAGAVSYVGYGFASHGWMMYAVMPIGMFAGLVFPSMNALMSHQIPKNAQGELQGAVASTFSLTAIIGPLMMTQLFGYFSSSAAPIYFPGAAFLFAVVLVLVSLTLFIRAARLVGGEELSDDSSEIEAAAVTKGQVAPEV